jgi:minimal PKS acyl carrier protein
VTTFNLTDLRRVLEESVGVEDDLTFDGGNADTAFIDLGYDSLALLELASQVSRRYGVPIPDEAVHEMGTPQAAVDYINDRLATAAV